jgi:hypothetical protein
MTMYAPLAAAALALLVPQQAAADCLADPTLNADFEALNGGVAIPTEGSCCMFDVCGLACPEPVEDPTNGTFSSCAYTILS